MLEAFLQIPACTRGPDTTVVKKCPNSNNNNNNNVDALFAEMVLPVPCTNVASTTPTEHMAVTDGEVEVRVDTDETVLALTAGLITHPTN
jgi:hypothetical protein